MRFSFLAIILLVSCIVTNVYGQDTLPNISVKKTISGKIVISWKNNYGATIKTINIQRSLDSSKFFTTIGSVLNPLNRDNGFVDAKPPYDRMYYRIFIAFDGGNYIFTKSYLPSKDSAIYIDSHQEANIPQPSGFISSRYIYTGKENNVIINLPNALEKKYAVKFFDANNKFMFEIKHIPEPFITLEKVNFKHAGWFNFELYENDILLEKYKFLLSKDYKKSSLNSEQGGRN